MRTTRAIEPGTGISREQIIGTSAQPAARAARAGKSASMSCVTVKIAQTMSSGPISFRASISRQSSRTASSIAGTVLAESCVAPRIPRMGGTESNGPGLTGRARCAGERGPRPAPLPRRDRLCERDEPPGGLDVERLDEAAIHHDDAPPRRLRLRVRRDDPARVRELRLARREGAVRDLDRLRVDEGLPVEP